jgi:hypothetical protein
MQKRIRYSDLKARGIVNSRQTLENWIRDHGFPPGQLTGPNSRTWGEDDVEAWLASRPEACAQPEDAPHAGGRRGDRVSASHQITKEKSGSRSERGPVETMYYARRIWHGLI